MSLSSVTDEEFQEMARRRLLRGMINNGARQKVIIVKDIELYLSGVWMIANFTKLLAQDAPCFQLDRNRLLSLVKKSLDLHTKINTPTSTNSESTEPDLMCAQTNSIICLE